MPLSLIVAMDQQGAIGDGKTMPWHMPADLKHFKRITTEHSIIMGRKTHQSIGKALPGRRNIVITRDHAYQAEGCEVAHSLEDALALVADEQEPMIIGGAEIYRQALPWVSTLYITWVDTDSGASVRFPEWDKQAWQEISRESHTADDKHAYDYHFTVYKKL